MDVLFVRSTQVKITGPAKVLQPQDLFILTNMIISFDGNVYAGKTTVINQISSDLGAKSISEHGIFLESCDFQDPWDLQLRYIEAEARRAKLKIADGIQLLDRSFVSMAAHVYAIYKIGKVDMRALFLEKMSSRMIINQVLIPDFFCFVRCSSDVIHARISMDNVRGTDPLYYTESYLEAIDAFNEAWIRKVDGIVIDTNTGVPIGLTRSLIDLISSSQNKRSTQKILGFLRELFTLPATS